jgi:ribosome-associated toxin RatA of RatAB toxin-antitoxin module
MLGVAVRREKCSEGEAVAQHIEITGEIAAPVNKVYQVVADVERYPEFLPGVREVERLEGDIVEMTVSMGLIDVSWKSKATFKPYESIVIDLVEGPFRQMDVRWGFTPEGDRTRVKYTTVSIPSSRARREPDRGPDRCDNEGLSAAGPCALNGRLSGL